MGGLNSREFVEMVEEEEGSPDQPRRVLHQWQDPRSPTLEITRTPIQVEKTPDSVLDPRSPTCGITRTPIYSYLTQPAAKPPHETTDTPKRNLAEASKDEGAPQCGPAEEAPKCDLKSGPGPTEDGCAVTFQIHSQPTSTATKEQARKKEGPRTSILHKLSPTSKKAKAKIAFNAHTNQDAASTQDGRNKGRSPLKVIESSQQSPWQTAKFDGSSPLAIVQRKQTSRLGMLHSPAHARFSVGSPGKYSTLAEGDKENCSPAAARFSRASLGRYSALAQEDQENHQH